MEGVAPWVVLAASIAVSVLVVGVLATQRRGRRRAMGPAAGSPLVTVDRARPGPVALRGRVRPGADGVVLEPLGGSAVVWYRLTAFGPRGGHRAIDDIVEVHSETEARDFLLDDGSRALARIAIGDAGFVVGRHVYGGSELPATGGPPPSTRHPLSAQHAIALRTRCARRPTRIVRADLQAVAPGTSVTVVGWLEWEGGDPVVVGRSPDHPLIVYGEPNA